MKVCFYRPFSFPLFDPRVPGQFGGAEVRAYTFARGLAARHRCQVAFIVDAEAPRPAGNFAGIEVHFQPRHRSCVSTARRSVGSAVQAASQRFLRSMRKRCGFPLAESVALLKHVGADVYCCFGATEASADVIRAASRLRARSVLFLVWDKELAEDCVPSIVVGKQRRRIQQARDELLQTASQIIVQSETQRQVLWQRFGRRGVLIRNPIDIQVPAHTSSEPRGSYALWIGRADTFHKRPDRCYELARRCPRIPFTMVINRADYAQYDELLERAPANVQLVQQVPYGEIDGYFAAARVLVNTSDVEGFPNTFLQAAKHGLPVVSYAVDPDDVLRTHGWGHVACGNLETMAEQLDSVWQGGADPQDMSRRARDYISRFHALQDRVRELEGVLGLQPAADLQPHFVTSTPAAHVY